VPIDDPTVPPTPPLDLPTPPEPEPLPPVVDEPIPQIDFSGVVYNDLNGNGTRDKNEPGIAGRRIYGDADNDGKYDAGEISTLTDTSGRYKLTLTSDTIKVRQVIPAGWYEPAAGASGALRAGPTAAAAESQGDEFATAKYSTRSGVVFRDLNHNGKRDPGEPGIAGAIVFWDSNNNGWADKNERTSVTSADGKWMISNVTAGVRTVRIQMPWQYRNLTRTTASYYKHVFTSGSTWTKDDFGYF
jgi:hypothetical protein